jgi:hypothetical protein
VKRARHVNTITSELLPQSGPGIAASRAVSAQRLSPRRPASPWSWLPTKPGGWGVLIALTAFGAAVGMTAYLAIEEIADSAVALRMQSTVIELSGTRASATSPPESVTSERVAEEIEYVDPPASDGAPVLADSLPPTQAAEKPAGRTAASENRIGKAPVRANQATHARGEPVAITAPATTADVGASSATIAVAGVAPEPPVSDRWEAMGAALAACSRENFFAGVVCAERVRLQYCEGFWGQVPHCRAATRPSGSR